MKIEESYLARRRFLGGMLGGGAAALGTGLCVPLTGFVGNLREEPPPPFVELSAADFDLSPGESKMIRYGRIPVLIFKTTPPQRELRIFEATCTHFDCPVGYLAEENRIFCGCHNGYYDVDGRVLSGPPPRPLEAFYWKFTGDKLLIAQKKEDLEKALAESQT